MSRIVVDVFLLPPERPPSALEAAVRDALTRLRGARPLAVAVTAWRPIDFEVYADPDRKGAIALAETVLGEARARDLICHRVPALPPDFPSLPLAGEIVIGLARQSPERLAMFGEAVAAALSSSGEAGALVAFGLLGRGQDAAGQRFDTALLESLTKGDDAGVAADADLWLDGRPDAELAHVFMLLGAAGPGSTADVLGYARRESAGMAVLSVHPGEAPTIPREHRRFTIPVKEISRG